MLDKFFKNWGLHKESEIQSYPSPKSLSVKKTNTDEVAGRNMMTVCPKSFEDIEMIVDCLIEGECSIIDMSIVKNCDFIRIIDFLSGAVYALNAELKRLQGDLYLVVPRDVNLNNKG